MKWIAVLALTVAGSAAADEVRFEDASATLPVAIDLWRKPAVSALTPPKAAAGWTNECLAARSSSASVKTTAPTSVR